MKSLRTFLGALAVALLAAGIAFAQRGPMGGGMAPPQFYGILAPTVGTGAAYQTEARGVRTDMEIAVVGREDSGGKPGYWFEMAMNPPQGGGQMYMKMLMVVDGKNVSATRMIMQMADQPPMEMPMQGMMGNMQQTSSTDVRETAERVGAEAVTTPAGTFNTEHYRAKDGSWDAWLAAEAGPWGLVKSVSRGTTMTLTKVIAGATSKITGTPQPMDMMQMMRGMGMGRGQ